MLSHAEMECLTDRCQQLLKQEADTKRELHDLTRLQVRLEEDKKQLSTDYISALEEKAKLRTDLTSVQAEVAAATMRSQSAEGETVKELRETKRKLAGGTAHGLCAIALDICNTLITSWVYIDMAFGFMGTF